MEPPRSWEDLSEEERQRTVARVYDETRHFMPVPSSMINQISRYGVLVKKSVDGSDSIPLHGPRNYWRDSRSNTPDGALIIHRDDIDPHSGNCQAFIHPPYGSTRQYRGERSTDYTAQLTLQKLGNGAKDCGFCAIIYQGVQNTRSQWILKWARRRWLRDHANYDQADVESRGPWQVECKKWIESNQAIQEDTISLTIVLRKGPNPLLVHLSLFEDTSQTQNLNENISKTTTEILEALRKDSAEIATLEYYTTQDASSQWAAFGPSPHINPSLQEEDGAKRLFFWISNCALSHDHCAKSPWYFDPSSYGYGWMRRLRDRFKRHSTVKKLYEGFPARLLRINWKQMCDQPRLALIETNRARYPIRYVAVSHVWAFTTPHKVTNATYPQYQDEVPWNDLSLGLRQAIFMAKSLGLEYIWIDSLCIIQDSIVDKQAELPRMSTIYGHADIVFAMHGSDLGLERVELKPLCDSFHDGDNPVYCRLKIDHRNLFRSPQDPLSWLGRAWCMQERIFAPRTIHFGGAWEEAFFECNTESICECGQLDDDIESLNVTHTLKKDVIAGLEKARSETDQAALNSNDELWRTYITVCEDYTARGVTFSTDTLLALSSLMVCFLPYLGEYYGGLWEHRLHLSLQWEASDTSRSRRHLEYVAPSFSWASRSGAVVWYIDSRSLPTSGTHYFAKMLDVSWERAGGDSNPCGRVRCGHITLEGRVTEMRIHESKEMWMPDGRIELTKADAKSCWVTLDSKDDYDELEPRSSVKCLELMRDIDGYHGNFVSGLILLPAKDGTSRYRRIGFSTMLELHFTGSNLETVTIV